MVKCYDGTAQCWRLGYHGLRPARPPLTVVAGSWAQAAVQGMNLQWQWWRGCWVSWGWCQSWCSVSPPPPPPWGTSRITRPVPWTPTAPLATPACSTCATPGTPALASGGAARTRTVRACFLRRRGMEGTGSASDTQTLRGSGSESVLRKCR